MIALLLVIALFAGWWIIGLGVLAALGADTDSLRVALSAPVLGSALVVLVLFVFSDAGMSMDHAAIPVGVVLLVGSVAVLAVRRPSIHRGVVAVLAVCLVGLGLVGWPMWTFEFHWIANANDDMANYSLLATQLLRHGLLVPYDLTGLMHDRDFATLLQSQHDAGSRPGADILLAAVSRITGHLPWQVFMPLILSFGLTGLCSVGALAMQATNRWWAAVLAAALLAVSPLSTLGQVQQLMPQVWGLSLAAALFALLMRADLHKRPGPRVREVVPIGLLATAVVLVYVELAATLALAYALYLAILVVRRQTSGRAILRLLIPATVIVLVILNAYLAREIAFVRSQASSGLRAAPGLPLFGYSLVPDALAAMVGLETEATGTTLLGADASIVIGAGLLLASLVAALRGIRHGVGAAAVLVVYAALAAVLAYNASDFGLFKLYMYLQPFLVASVVVWIANRTRRKTMLVAVGLLAVLVALQLPVQFGYVRGSRQPLDLRDASAESLMPAFQRFFAHARLPIVSVTENTVLAKLEAASVGQHSLYFISANVFRSLANRLGGAALRRALRVSAWEPRRFALRTAAGPRWDPFEDNTLGSQVLASGRCVLVLPTGSEEPINRRSLPDGTRPLIEQPCSAAQNTLVFTASTLGQGFYASGPQAHKTLFPLEADPYFPGHTMSGVGRYLLFRVLGPTVGMRIVLSFTETLAHDSSNLLPPAAVVGARTEPLPLEGRGSARVISAPLRPQMIAGQPYLALNLGRDGRLFADPRSGVRGLWGSSVPLDPRLLTGFLRDISIISPSGYSRQRPPAALAHFPIALANPSLEYSGIYEDGWMGGEGYALLAGGPPSELLVRGQIPTGAGGRLELFVNGRLVYSASAPVGDLNVRVPVGASGSSRRLELRFARTVHLASPDLRPAAAHLTFLGFVAP